MSNSSENIAVTADGYLIKKGKSYFYGERKVKVLDIEPVTERACRVKVTHLGYLYPDNLTKKADGKYIGT